MLKAPSQDAAAAEARGKSQEFEAATCMVDQQLRRIGYQGVVRQLRNGVRCVSVPALVSSCSSLLTLLAAGESLGSKLPEEPPTKQQQQPTPAWTPPPPPLPPPRVSSLASESPSISVSCANESISSRRGGWRRLFSRRWSNKAASVPAANAGNNAAAIDESPKMTDESKSDTGLDVSVCCLKELLVEIRRSTERLMTLAGKETPTHLKNRRDALSLLKLTPLQREVFYLQTRWPEMISAISSKLAQNGRNAKRAEEIAAARSRADAGARVRSIAKMAIMEAELRRLRAELRRRGDFIVAKRPSLRATAYTHKWRQNLKRLHRTFDASASPTEVPIRTPFAAMAGDMAMTEEPGGAADSEKLHR